MIRYSFFLAVIAIALLSGCSSSDLTQNMSADERFAIGKQLFDEEEYLDAKKEFEVIKLQFPGSSVADDAQYYLAECYFKREEFLLAAEEYKAIKRNLQGSPFIPLAQYKVAMCYYNLAPQFHLDQQYTLKAIDWFQTFIEYYPTNELVAEATAKIKELNTRLAEKDYASGLVYMKMGYYKSAAYYFKSVTEKFHDTPFAEPAHYSLAQALLSRKKYDDARKEIAKYLEKYPGGEHKTEIEAMKKELEDLSLSGSATQSLQTGK